MIGWDDDDCPCDLVFSERDQACVFPCLPFNAPEGQVRTLYILLVVFSWLSFLCGWFYCVTAAFRRELRQFPLSSTLTLQFVLSFGTIGMVFAANVGLPFVLCKDEVTLAGRSEWACTFNLAMSLFTAIAGIHAWTAFNFSIVLSIAKVQQKGREWPRWFVLLWVFIPAFIGVTVIIATNRFGAPPNSFSCAISAKEGEGLSDPILWIFWLAPLCFWLSLNLVFMACILFFIAKSAYQSNTPLLRLLRKQVRLFLFYLWFIVGVALSILNSIYGNHESQTWRGRVEDYLVCVNTNLLYGYIAVDDDDCSPCDLDRTSLPFGLVLAQLLLNSTLGLVCFLLLGFRRDIFQWWLEYWQLAWREKEFFVMDKMEQKRNQSVKTENDSSASQTTRNNISVRSADQL